MRSEETHSLTYCEVGGDTGDSALGKEHVPPGAERPWLAGVVLPIWDGSVLQGCILCGPERNYYRMRFAVAAKHLSYKGNLTEKHGLQHFKQRHT